MAGVSKLPTTPSKLIRLALKDLKICEQDSSFNISTFVTYFNTYDSPCEVDIVGSVIAQTLGHRSVSQVSSTNFREDEFPLKALYEFSRGHIVDAFSELGFNDLGLDLPKNLRRYITIPYYHTDPESFKGQMHYLADELERKGY
jgi:hypothetical protein